jgi:hypothetical protein
MDLRRCGEKVNRTDVTRDPNGRYRCARSRGYRVDHVIVAGWQPAGKPRDSRAGF